MALLQVCSQISTHTDLFSKSITPLLFNYLTSILQRLLMLLNYLVYIESKYLIKVCLRLQCLKPITKLFAFFKEKKNAPLARHGYILRLIYITSAYSRL